MNRHERITELSSELDDTLTLFKSNTAAAPDTEEEEKKKGFTLRGSGIPAGIGAAALAALLLRKKKGLAMKPKHGGTKTGNPVRSAQAGVAPKGAGTGNAVRSAQGGMAPASAGTGASVRSGQGGRRYASSSTAGRRRKQGR